VGAGRRFVYDAAMVRRLLVALALAPAACGDDAAAPDGRPPQPPDAGPCEPAIGEPALALERVTDEVRKPVHLVSPPGDPRLFVLELDRGIVRIFDRDGTRREPPFLQIDDEIGAGFEQGILSLAFHPRYPDDPRFFVSWARDGDDALVVEEWRVSGDPDRADRGSRRRLFEIPHTVNFHYGAHLAFGPDGLLYVASGDGGPHDDPEGHGQDLGSLRGKLLRVDVDRRDDGLPYGIPADNPFVGRAGARPEVWALGLRNPWRFWIDPPTRHTFIGDVGFFTTEEIDVVPGGAAGLNFGWAVVEGDRCVDPQACDRTGLTPPVHSYGHVPGQCAAVIVGPVYRGCAMPGHHGKLFFADFCAGRVQSLVYSAGEVAFLTAYPDLTVPGALSAFGVDSLGEMYVLDFDEGTIDRIVPAR
jgi:glucose/arabinose dehydrogenase